MRGIKLKLIIFFLIYAFLFILSEQKANFFLALSLVLIVPLYFLKYFFRDFFYRNSIWAVPKQFVRGVNYIQNDNCVIRYIPDLKIIVMDNIASNRKEIRTVLLNKYGVSDINKCWGEVCSLFDSYTYLDMIVSFWKRCGYHTNIVSIENKNYKEENPDKIEVKSPKIPVIKNDVAVEKEITGATFEIEKNKISKQEPIAGISDTEHVDIDQLAANFSYNKNNIAEENLTSISDLPSYEFQKIDINSADSETLSTLPGINIIIAKKAVAYRNKNGKFNSIEEFYNVIGIKDFFKDKISDKIVITKSVHTVTDANFENNNGRIVDL